MSTPRLPLPFQWTPPPRGQRKQGAFMLDTHSYTLHLTSAAGEMDGGGRKKWEEEKRVQHKGGRGGGDKETDRKMGSGVS